jgi:antitoxin component YwqK of YwqJK toxin-antitoxin module
MRVVKRIFLTILIIAVVGAGALITYIYFKESKKNEAFTIIPSNAIFIIETTNLTKGWSTLSDSKVWKHTMLNEYFKDINGSACTLDSLIKDNNTMNSIFENRKLLISAHMISEKDYDFLFVVDLQKASKITFIIEYIQNSLLSYFNYTMNRRDYMDDEILELVDLKAEDTLYLSFIDNLMVCSYTPSLLELTIKEKEKNYFSRNKDFKNISSGLSSKDLFKFYVNYSQLPGFLRCYMDDVDEMSASIANSLLFTGINFNIKEEQLFFDGYTSLNDSMTSYLKALSKVDPGESRVSDILSDKTALYVSMCFSNFNDFFGKLKEEFSKLDSNAESYQKKIDKVQKLLKIDLQKDFFDWIGNEISYSRMRPADGNAREEDIIVAIHAKNIEDARIGLNNITSQIRKRSIFLKFKEVTYKDYEINYLDIKGFFKLFFGKLFGKLEKPYFTYINDYVVFSNSPSMLMDVIDDFTEGKTMGKNEKFMAFKSNFSSKTNASIFVQMPKLYSYLYFFSNAEKKKNIQKNKDLILSFTRIGFQLVSNGKMFKTKLIADFDENALLDDELEKFETAAEEISNNEIASLSFKPALNLEDIADDGEKSILFENGNTKYEGVIVNGKPDGKWISYSETGNKLSEVFYKQGSAEGAASFFYDTKTEKLKINVFFKEDLIIDQYKGYYENGKLKAQLEYKDGKPNGSASFYYTSGILKAVGEYKDGIKIGKWKYYTETGQVFDKQKWKKGNIK